MEPTNDEFAGIEFECPQCGTVLDRHHEHCPHCGRALDEEFYATYRLPASPVVKIIAFVFLIGALLVALALLVYGVFLFESR
ncbi:MAG: zinc ribbon domain-containing protein [Phycisphaerae bacterium]